MSPTSTLEIVVLCSTRSRSITKAMMSTGICIINNPIGTWEALGKTSKNDCREAVKFCSELSIRCWFQLWDSLERWSAVLSWHDLPPVYHQWVAASRGQRYNPREAASRDWAWNKTSSLFSFSMKTWALKCRSSPKPADIRKRLTLWKAKSLTTLHFSFQLGPDPTSGCLALYLTLNLHTVSQTPVIELVVATAQVILLTWDGSG